MGIKTYTVIIEVEDGTEDTISEALDYWNSTRGLALGTNLIWVGQDEVVD